MAEDVPPGKEVDPSLGATHARSDLRPCCAYRCHRHHHRTSPCPRHLVSAFVGANRLVLGQVAVAVTKGSSSNEERHGNEITAIPKLLELLDLAGATVSIDAIGCQREICRKILQRGGQYVLCVKDNQ